MLKHLWDLSWKPCESISNGGAMIIGHVAKY